MSIEWVMPSNQLILCCPLLLLPSIFRSIRVFSNESALHIRWSKYWSFSNSPSNWYSDLMSFRIDWFDFLAIQGTLKSLLQHHNLKHQFFGAQTFRWSNSYILTWLVKNHSFDYTDLCRHHLAEWCLCFLICCLGLLIAFLPRSKHLLIS